MDTARATRSGVQHWQLALLRLFDAGGQGSSHSVRGRGGTRCMGERSGTVDRLFKERPVIEQSNEWRVKKNTRRPQAGPVPPLITEQSYRDCLPLAAFLK